MYLSKVGNNLEKVNALFENSSAIELSNIFVNLHFITVAREGKISRFTTLLHACSHRLQN